MTLFLKPSDVPESLSDWLGACFPDGVELTRENCEALALSTERYGGRYRLSTLAGQLMDADTVAAYRSASTELFKDHWKIGIKEKMMAGWSELKVVDWMRLTRILGGIFYDHLNMARERQTVGR